MSLCVYSLAGSWHYQGLGVFFGKRTSTKLYPIRTTKKDTGLRSSRVSNEELLMPSMQYCGILTSEMVNWSLALQVNLGPQTAVCGWGALEVSENLGPMLVQSNLAWSGKKAITTRKTLPIPATPLPGCKPLPTGTLLLPFPSRRRSAAEKVKYQVRVASPRCNSCACFRSCPIPGTRPAAPSWTRQAQRGPCLPTPTSTTVQATRTQEHEDASFSPQHVQTGAGCHPRSGTLPPLAPPTERERQRGRRKARPVPLPRIVHRAGTGSGGQRGAPGPGKPTATLQSTLRWIGISRVRPGSGEGASGPCHWGATGTASSRSIWYEYCMRLQLLSTSRRAASR